MTARKKVESAADNTTGHVWDGDLRGNEQPHAPLVDVACLSLTSIFRAWLLGDFIQDWVTMVASSAGLQRAQHDRPRSTRPTRRLEPIYAQIAEHEAGGYWQATPRRWQSVSVCTCNNCAQCHASDARGSKGFPNLTDGDWLHGGTPEIIP
jgi:cytochrome c oxidase cbb3-type subunit 3